MIVIIDIGVGNVGSIENMLKKVGVSCSVSSLVEDIEGATALILPGVGAFDHVMGALRGSGLLEVIERKVLVEHTPFLGICIGMQLLFDSSDEGLCPGLSWIPGEVKRFSDTSLKIPHMGWNIVNINKDNPLLPSRAEEMRFYFVHSYHVVCDDEYAIASAVYGKDFICSVRKGNIFGVQFHPEKSHRFGMQLFKDFVSAVC